VSADPVDPHDAVAAARSRAERADDPSIWWHRAHDAWVTHVLRRDGSWTIYEAAVEGKTVLEIERGTQL
jgi:hypothetical protein